jgi:hypothetical protein
MTTTSNQDVELSWSLDAKGSALEISYALVNRLETDIFVADRLIAYHQGKRVLVPERVIVTAGDAEGSVRFARSLVKTRTTQMDHPPGAQRLAAGATHRGSARVDLPVRGWHNYGTPPATPPKPTTAILEIAYLVGDDIEWGSVKLTDGTDVTIPQLPSYRRLARTIRSAPQPIP